MTADIITPKIVRVRTERVSTNGNARIMSADDVALTHEQWWKLAPAAKRLGVKMPYPRPE